MAMTTLVGAIPTTTGTGTVLTSRQVGEVGQVVAVGLEAVPVPVQADLVPPKLPPHHHAVHRQHQWPPRQLLALTAAFPCQAPRQLEVCRV